MYDAKQSINTDVFINQRPMYTIPGRRYFKCSPFNFRRVKQRLRDCFQIKSLFLAVNVKNQVITFKSYILYIMV